MILSSGSPSLLSALAASTACTAAASAFLAAALIKSGLSIGKIESRPSLPLLHHRGYAVVGRLNAARYGKSVERVHGPVPSSRYQSS